MTSLPALESLLRIVFGRGGNSLPNLESGWADAEDGSTRMLGHASSVSLPLSDREGALFLQVKLVAPLGAAIPRQRVRLIVNGYEIAVHDLGDGGHDFIAGSLTLTDYLPAEAVQGEWAPRLVIDHPAVAGPELGVRSIRVLRVIERSLRGLPGQDAPPAPPLRDMLLDFESLGEGAAFTRFRRRLGMRPLELIQGGQARLADWMALLDSDFALFATPDAFRVVEGGRNGEAPTWWVRGATHGFAYDTGVPVTDRPSSAVAAREQARLGITGRRLRERLTAGSRLLLFHQEVPVSDERIIPLLAAVRDRGPNAILWVTPADAEHAPGSVELLMQGLLRGYVAPDSDDAAERERVAEGWSQMCRLAWRSWRAMTEGEPQAGNAQEPVAA